MGSPREELATDAEGYWQCPHPGLEDHDQCLFHLPPDQRPDDRSPSEQMLEILRAPASDASRTRRRRRKQFIGARIPRLTLEDEVVAGPDNFALDLRLAEIDWLGWDSTTLEVPVDLRGATVDHVSGTNLSCGRLFAQAADFGTVAFDHAVIDRAYFDDASAELIRLYWGEIEYANFHEASVRHANFMYGDFGEMGFFDIEFDVTTFYGASFDGVYFNDASFGYVNFESTSGGSCHFVHVDTDGATFKRSNFRKLRFNHSTFERVRFDDVDLDICSGNDSSVGVATFDGGRFGSLELDGVRFYRTLSMEAVTVEEELWVTPAAVEGSGAGYVSLRGAELPGGRLGQPPDTPLVYDLEEATVGDLRLTAPGEESVLDRIRLFRTEFDGFDFSKQRALDLEGSNFVIHELYQGAADEIAIARAMQDTVVDLHPAIEENHIGAASKYNVVDFDAVSLEDAPEQTGARARELAEQRVDSSEADEETAIGDTPGPEDLETTYLMAKNGATDAGNSHAAGRFFEKERTYRRRAHWRAMSSGELPIPTRIRRGTEWLRNGLFALTTGYGERPRRVVGTSLGTIGGFAVVFVLLQPSLEGVEDAGIIEYLIFSFQSFITFLVGSPPQSPSLLVRVVSSIEGFVGAFFVALFVFALTRQIHR